MIKVLFSIVLLFISTTSMAEDASGSTIGYQSYDEALNDLKSNPKAKVTVQQGWTIIEVNKDNEMALWSFTSKGHFAHPAVVKRNVVESKDTVSIIMNALCGAAKPECDKLIKQFEQLNEKISQNMHKDS